MSQLNKKNRLSGLPISSVTLVHRANQSDAAHAFFDKKNLRT
jgi:hypothetical protein